MRLANSAVLQTPATSPDRSRMVEIGVAPDGASVSILAGSGDLDSAEIILPSEELPRLIVALLRAADLSQRASGNDHGLVFPVEKGSIGLWGKDFIFTVTMAHDANMAFQLDRASAAALLEALSSAFRCSSRPPAATH